MTDIAALLAQTGTSAVHQEICNIVIAMCNLSNLYSNVKTTEKEKVKIQK